MSLIKCSECGRDISDTSEKCVHCGCPIEKKKSKKVDKKLMLVVGRILAVVIIAILIVVIIGKVSSILPHEIQNDELIQLMEYTSSIDIKNHLGDDYEHKIYESINTTTDEYKDIVIDGKTYAQVQICYDSSGTFERIYLATDFIWSEKDYKTLVADLVEQYGSEYDYEEDNEMYQYGWGDIESSRRVSCSIFAANDEEGKYWVRINSYHN